MKKYFRYLIFFVIGVLLTLGLYSCSGINEDSRGQNNNAKQSDKKDPADSQNDKKDFNELNEKITNLLPEKENYKWVYNGFAEYAHVMTLRKIERTSDKVKYIINGEVDDVSGGESESDYSIELTYIVHDGKLIQEKTEEMMMDSKFNTFELIKAPLKKGTKWTQERQDESGNKYVIESEITNISEKQDSKVFTVMYKDKNSNYYEERQIKEGIGVISFRKLWETQEGDSFEVGYSLYEEVSGYIESK